MSADEIVQFGDAEVGQRAYTWEIPGGDFGDYRFETAGRPIDLHDGEALVVRKLWQLVEVVELPLEAAAEAPCDCEVTGPGRTYEQGDDGLVSATIPCPHRKVAQ